MLRDDLKKDGVPDDHIIFERYTSEYIDEDITDRGMHDAINHIITPHYIL